MTKFFTAIILLAINLSLYAQNDKATYKKLNKALKLIENEYVDSVNTKEITTRAVQAMLRELDPHSIYLSAESLKKNNEALNGSFAGVGIHYQILKDTLLVLSVVPEGPSEKAGLLAGDKLIAIDEELAVGEKISNSFFSTRLRGKRGSSVELTVIRHKDKSIHNIEVIRGTVPIHTLSANYLINKNTGYIRIRSFSRTTVHEFKLAITDLKSQGMKNLILDLRGNPGGLMVASIYLADNFIKKDRLIVYTQGVNSPRKEYKSTPDGSMEKGRLIVLIDENSASASEILAGAIQDWDRGLIMGRRSFGKGLVGRNYTLPDGSAIRITTGRYYTPSGRCIQKNYEPGKANKYNEDLAKRYEQGELYSADSIQLPDSLKYYTNAKRMVYGGGAIMPDWFVPIDTSYYSDYLIKLNNYGLINYYAGLYFDAHLEELRINFPNFEDFEQGFAMNEQMFEEMNKMAFEKSEIKGSEEEITISKNYIHVVFKAYLARNLYRDDSYYKIVSQVDNMLIEANEVIQNNKIFRENKIHE